MSTSYLVGVFGSGLAPGTVPAPAPISGHAVLRYTHLLQVATSPGQMIPVTAVRLPIVDGVLCSATGVPSTTTPIPVQATDDPLLVQSGAIFAQIDLIFDGGSEPVQALLALPTDVVVDIATTSRAGGTGAIFVSGLTPLQLEDVSASVAAAQAAASTAVDAAAEAVAPTAEMVALVLTDPASAGAQAMTTTVASSVAGAVPGAVDEAVAVAVPPLAQASAAAYLATDPGVAAAAAVAVTADIAGRDLVEGTDGRMPQWTTTEDRLMVLLDAARRETWLGVNDSDGGPTPWALTHLQRSLGVGVQPVPGYLLALADSERRMTDLAIRDTDGQLADFVVDRLRPRILDGYLPPAPPVPRSYADTRWVEGTETYPIRADSTRAAGFGSSSMQGMDSRMAALFASKGVTYYSGGKGSERSEHIAARIGSIPAVLTVAGGEIPASGSVAVTTATMALTSALRPYPGTLAGVPGTLAYDTATAGYRFTRTAAGVATSVPAPTPFIPDAASYRDAIMVLWMGKNNMGMAGADSLVISQTDATVDWLAPHARRVLVLGHFVDLNTAVDSLEYTQIAAVNAAHKARYGRLFVDVAAYLSSAQVWTDTGITPTVDDLAKQAAGIKPPSLSENDGHLNAAGYDAVMNYLIAPRLAELDWLRTNQKSGIVPVSNVNSIVADGQYFVSAAQGTTANGYPVTSPGILEVATDPVTGAVAQAFTSTGSQVPVVYRRNKPAGGVFGATWASWPYSRITNTEGRRLYVWDAGNGREQLVYGDTGWRNISALLGAAYQGTLYIKREGYRVSIAADLACAEGLTTLNGTFLAEVPAGFTSRGAPWAYFPVRTGGAAGYFSMYRQGNALTFVDSGAVTAAMRCRFEISWSTTAVWPTTLPGTADGTIPNT